MGNFPLTRIALNLSLIVALAIQPVAAVRGDRRLFGEMLGKRHPHMSRLWLLRSRASERSVLLLLWYSKGCRKRRLPSQAAVVTMNRRTRMCSVHLLPIWKRRRRLASCPTRTNPESGVQSVCLCEQDSQPLSDSSPRRPVNESRTSLAIGNVGPVGADGDGRLSLSTARDGTDIPTLAHFSQIVLCIWRL